MYNEDFKYYKNFKPIKSCEIDTWNFEECNCATPEYMNTYFNQQRFFDKLTYMDWAKEVLEKLKEEYELIIVSSGYSPNLVAKGLWIENNLPYCDFIGVNLKEYRDKSHINMSDGIFIDDSMNNLMTSNAQLNICFGDIYSWNKDWSGIRCFNWNDIINILGGE